MTSNLPEASGTATRVHSLATLYVYSSHDRHTRDDEYRDCRAGYSTVLDLAGDTELWYPTFRGSFCGDSGGGSCPGSGVLKRQGDHTQDGATLASLWRKGDPVYNVGASCTLDGILLRSYILIRTTPQCLRLHFGGGRGGNMSGSLVQGWSDYPK